MGVKWLLWTPLNLNSTEGGSCCSPVTSLGCRLLMLKIVNQGILGVALPPPPALPVGEEIAPCCYCWVLFCFPFLSFQSPCPHPLYSADIREAEMYAGRWDTRRWDRLCGSERSFFSALTPPSLVLLSYMWFEIISLQPPNSPVSLSNL